MKDVEVLRSFGVLNRTFLAYFSHAIANQGLSYSEGAILANIGDRPGTNQDALALDLVIDKAAIARAVKGLKEKGFVRVKRAPSDGRANELTLARSGERLLSHIADLNDAWIRFVTSDLTAVERRKFFESLGKLVARTKQLPPEWRGRPS
ncbi:MAG TPA: MarR family winged helix-turn-helix transcriptional regulator [Polyangiaceae bacterium]|jgi:DNA-binding MarR family transcriptional regulator|nr:MarR family winged helix-turn-helix transcriptional regulator [Polyangiaceae bacterium]